MANEPPGSAEGAALSNADDPGGVDDAAPSNDEAPATDGAPSPVAEEFPSAREMARLIRDEDKCTWEATREVIVFEEKNPAALETALRLLGVEIRFDLRALREEWSWDGGQTWARMTVRSTAALRRAIAERCRYKVYRGDSPLKYGREDWTLASNALLYRRECDPFLDWLKALPPWDGTKRLNGWLGEVFDLADKDDPLAKWAGRFIFLGPVERAYEPGAKLDEMPVLIGRGGIGKSTALEWVLPPERREWFTAGLNLAASDKVRAEALQGRVIVEVPDMAGIRRAERENLKGFVSRTDDGAIRLAYRSNPEPLRRRAILVGTADHARPLPDDPNLRRFVPVRLGGNDRNAARVREFLDKNREQLWAEALARHRQGEKARLPDELKPRQAKATAAARGHDAIPEEKLAAWVAAQTAAFTKRQCAVAIGLISEDPKASLSRSLDNHLSRALKDQGCVSWRAPRSSENGQRPRLWERKV
ncbi:MAG: hypothetical protein OXG19_09750 [Chloroflexi bacterium]|nr:hypothetical protein [Chloroflexota bacterium]